MESNCELMFDTTELLLLCAQKLIAIKRIIKCKSGDNPFPHSTEVMCQLAMKRFYNTRPA